ncbi:MAG: hypothetical protein PHU71_06625, partial [Candidatus Gracilibacteria bacterium]|nr:hypothetical protein [Candidatus Gracilibacteria bacterium]
YHNIPYGDFRKNRALSGAIKECVFLGADCKEYTRATYDYNILEINPNRNDSNGNPVVSYLIEISKTEKYSNGMLVETTASKVELAPGKYQMLSRIQSMTDHFNDGVHLPTTMISYQKFDTLEDTNEMRLVQKISNMGNTNVAVDITKDAKPLSSPSENTATYEYNSNGNITRQVLRYTGSGLAPVPDKMFEYEYDNFGNCIKEINSSGSPSRIVEKVYDSRLRQYVVEARAIGDVLTFKSMYEINYTSAFGGVNKKTDPNGSSTYYEYDSYGRLNKQYADTGNGKEKMCEYTYDTKFPMSGKVTLFPGDSSGEQPIEMRTYVDGTARALHTVRTATDQSGKRYIKTGKILYDTLGRVSRKSQTD